MEFIYQRSHGKKDSYRVTITIIKKCDENLYRFRSKIFSSQGELSKVLERDIDASDAAVAMNKAIALMKTDIEQLNDMVE